MNEDNAPEFQVRVTVEIVNRDGEVIDNRGNPDLRGKIKSVRSFYPLSCSIYMRSHPNPGAATDYMNTLFSVLKSIEELVPRNVKS